eukprot:m.261685 g.261685  ORF g.261685 m.261685 type:complete len:576 (-) comp42806_c0_seq1:143-1870(-)
MMGRTLMMTCVIALAIFASTSAAKTLTVEASIDLVSTRTPFPHYWKRCVGSGHMLLGTRADWRNHLQLAVTELGFTGIRGHGILDDDMSVLPHKPQGKDAPLYEFYNVDQVFDFLVSLDIKPVVELSFMPKALVTCGGTNQSSCNYAFNDAGSYKGMVMPPDDFNDWYDLVHALADHFVSRYGLEEIATWHFEVWNEMWGISFPQPYMQLYNASAAAVKNVHKSLKIGGPATMQTLDVADFIAACNNQSNPVPVDFISTHFYPTDPQCTSGAGQNDPDCFAHTVLAAQKLAKKADLPFFITEYNDGLGASSRDDSSAAAFVIRHMGLMQDLDMFSWWTFSDVFEEGWMRAEPFHNGYGMMTMHGVRKPTWRAFEMLMGAGAERVPVTGMVSPVDDNATVSVLATLGESDLQIFVANYHRLGAVEHYKCNEATKQCTVDPTGTYTDPSLCGENCVKYGGDSKRRVPSPRSVGDCPSQNVTITIVHTAEQGKVLHMQGDAQGLRIDEDHANPQQAWIDMGSPSYPTPAQIVTLNAASVIKPTPIHITAISPTSSSLSFNMPPFSVLHITLANIKLPS